MLFCLMLVAFSAMGQQDLFKWRVAAHVGINRSLSDIESSYSDINWDRSRTLGLELSRSLGYGVSFGLGVEQARLSGYDVLSGRKDRALNFMAELNTAQMELAFRMDNGKLLKYNARFAPFFSIGVGVGQYDVFGDLYSASGSRYHYWDDGTIRDQAEGGANADMAQVITNDGDFETRLTDLATEDGKSNDQLFVFIPARLGLKWRICDRMAAELYYGFNWTFTDGIDDVHDAYPENPASNELAYISNPTGRSGQRGDAATNDKYQSVGLNLAYYFGRRSTSYRMEPIYVDDRSLPPPPKPIAPPQPKSSAAPQPKTPPPPTNVVINVERITVGSLSVDTLHVGTVVQRTAMAKDTTLGNSIRKTKLDSIMARESRMDSLRFDTLNKATSSSMLDSTGQTQADSVSLIAPDSLRIPLPKATVVMSNDTVKAMSMDTLRTTLPDSLKRIAPDSLRRSEPKATVGMPEDTVKAIPMDTTRTTMPDSIAPSMERNTKRVEDGTDLPPDTMRNVPAGRLKTEPATPSVSDTIQPRSSKAGADPGRVDTVYVDREVPVTRYEQQAPNNTQQPQQVIIRDAPRERSKTNVVPVPVILPSGKTKTVTDPALQDSLQRSNAENQRLRLLVDSIKGDTATLGVYGTRVAPLDTTPAPPGVRPEDYAFIINDLLAERSLTLERYIELLDSPTSAAETDSLKQRIVAMDLELERLRSEGSTSKDTSGKVMSKGTRRTLMDSISFGLGSSRVGVAERGRLLAMGKQIASEKVERVLVTGQTDRSGDPAFNLQLSQKRADAVKRVLVEAGVPSASITAKGLGDQLAQDVHNESERIVVVQVVKPAKKKQE